MRKKITIIAIVFFVMIVIIWLISDKEYNSNNFNGEKYYQYYSGDLSGSSNLYESVSVGIIVNRLFITSNGEIIIKNDASGLMAKNETIKILSKEELDKLNELIEKCEDKKMTSSFSGANGGVSWVNRDGKKIVLYNSSPSIHYYIYGGYTSISEFSNNGRNAKKLVKYIDELLYD